MQINKINIKFNKKCQKWQTIADNRILEEFETEEQAKKYAKNTKDFKKIKGNQLTNLEKNVINELIEVSKELNNMLDDDFLKKFILLRKKRIKIINQVQGIKIRNKISGEKMEELRILYNGNNIIGKI